VVAPRAGAEKYTTTRLHSRTAYKIFLHLPQKQYHFTITLAFEAAISFNPEHPTLLLYEKHGTTTS